MDLDSVMVELNAVRPADFTAARNAYAAQAREAGDRELAAAISGLRKPTVAVWTAGLPARLRPEETRRLLRLGEALRGAHRTLDGEQLRKLSHDQHAVIGGLAAMARSLAAEAGQAVSEPVLHEVEQILHAVLADGEVAARWAAGRLTKAPDAVVGFAGLEPLPGAAPPRQEEAAARPAGAEPRRPRTAGAGGREGQARRERAEAARASARAEFAEARTEADRLRAARDAARELADGAAAEVSAVEEEMSAVRERLEAATTARADAAAGLREAGRAAAKAQRRAESAARKVEKLGGAAE
ncbi:hypothetical protein ACFYYB_19320 [Streptomyces sp. NPDC002886]|uniref:hypothetical protein n=1 Tax=Streptomyces sp. NPDC002886 TaxID=3364667 RepID=UPI00369F1DBF